MNVKFSEPLDVQFLEEAAASLGEAGRKLTRSLEALKNHDAEITSSATAEACTRAELVAAAGEALWALVVQRELLGFRDQEFIGANYEVPEEVWKAMGPRREGI